MSMEKEALTNTIESDLAKRNRNWDKIETHLEDYAELLAGGTPYELTLINGWTGTLKVKKNKLNQLHIWGVITPGITDIGTIIIERMPAEYRVNIDGVSTIAIPAHTTNGGIIGLAYVSGDIRIYRPAADEVGTNALRISYIIQSA